MLIEAHLRSVTARAIKVHGSNFLALSTIDVPMDLPPAAMFWRFNPDAVARLGFDPSL